MNTPNNKRSRDTDEAIIRAGFELLEGQKKPISKITVREICELAGINRSTFYAHYTDVYDMFDRVERQVAKMYSETMVSHLSTGGIQAAIEGLFAFVGAYRDLYSIYFKEIHKMAHMVELMIEPFNENIRQLKSQDLGYGVPEEMKYHYNFFTAGLMSVMATWIDGGCKEEPHEMFLVLTREYGDSSLLRKWLGENWSEQEEPAG